MTSLLLAALISMSPAEAHAVNHKHHARPHSHHHRARPPAVRTGFTWVWVSGHWQRRGPRLVWVRGHWNLRPNVPNHHHHRR